MQDIIQGISIGMAFVLAIFSFRQKQRALMGYWVLACTCLATLSSEVPPVWGVAGLLPLAIALYYAILYFFAITRPFRKLLSSLFPALISLVIGVFFPSIRSESLGLAGLLVVVVIVVVLHRQYRLRGISILINSGPRVAWINWATLHLLINMAVAYGWPDAKVLTFTWLPWLLFSVWRLSALTSFEPLDSAGKYSKSTLSTAEKARLTEALQRLITQEDFFIRPDSSLQSLARELHTTVHSTSQVLNESKGKTFFELQAQVRVRRAKVLLLSASHGHLKIEEIGHQVGYASKSSFNTTFKKITGTTPSLFRSQNVRPHKVERPTAGVERESLGFLDTFDWIQNSSVMFSNFFKIYFRTQLRNKLYSVINLTGLVAGLCSSLLIFVYLQHELSYDRFHDRAEDIYRVIWRSDNPQTRTPHPAAQALVRDFPQLESAVSFSPVYGPGLTLQSIYVRNPQNDQMFREPDIYSADSTFFQVFDFQLLSGEATEVLDDVGEIVISETLARKYFGDRDPVGQLLEFVEYDFSGVVSGVMADAPQASHFHPGILISYVSRKAADPDLEWWTWADFGHFNYIKLTPDSDAKALEEALISWLPKYFDFSEDDLADLQARHQFLELQPITDIHLYSDVRWELEANGNIIFIRILVVALIFLVTIAGINFINLSTARAFERVKEMGIRRSLGALQGSISLQFMLESIVTTLIALAVALGLAYGVLPFFSDLAGIALDETMLLHPLALIFGISVAVVVGLLTGLYPSIVVNGQKPVEALKGKFTKRVTGGFLRQTLLLVQFGVSVVMIFGSLMVMRQVHYIEEKDLGFDTEEVLVMEIHDRDEMRRLQAMKSEIAQLPGVMDVAGISNLPGTQFNQNPVLSEDNAQHVVSFAELMLDYGTLELLDLELLEGRWLDRSMGLDSAGLSFIVNRAAIEQLNLSNPFNAPIRWVNEAQGFQGRIVGVIEDFHYKSLHRSIQPLIMQINPGQMNYLLIKLAASTDVNATVAELDRIHQTFDDDLELDYFFLDGLIDDQYQAERRALGIFNVFTTLAIAMAAMGLLGMAFLVVTQRTKEIGIRKVIGARSVDIWWHELRPFLLIIVTALVVGLPISYWIMERWLDGFAYRTYISWQPFVGSALVLVVVAVASVSVAVLRTILADPSKSLRYE